MAVEGFYVSVVDGGRRGLLLGPLDTHEEALGRVGEVRRWVVQRQPRAHFYGFGTARVLAEQLPQGSLNEQTLPGRA